jgi:opacity protein-like surface antigen
VIPRPAILGVAMVLALAGPALADDVFVVSAGNNVGTAGDLPLRYAENDASGFAAVMQKLGGANGRQSAVLLGDSADGLRRALQTTNARIRSLESGRKRRTVLVVYYSGHADASGLHQGASVMPWDELRDLVKGSPAMVRLLIVDGCRSGTVTRVKGLKKPSETFAIAREGDPGVEGVAIITSSAAGEDSHESDRLRGSFFTHHLLNGLRGIGDRNKDRRVTLDEAYGYAYGETLRSSGRASRLQHPTYDYDIKGRGGLVLTHLDSARSQTSRLDLGPPGLYIVSRASDASIVAELRSSVAAAGVVLPPGKYVVQHRTARAYHQWEVGLEAGEIVALGGRESRTLDYARLLRKGGGEPSTVHGLQLLGGVRGELLAGEGVIPQVQLGYGADLEWLTVSVRGRWSRGTGAASEGDATWTRQELGLGVVLERFLDLSRFSFSVGLGVEGVLHMQSYTTRGDATDRTGWGVGLNLLLGMEYDLGAGISLRLEGGPRTDIYERTLTEGGAPVGTELATPLTFHATGGLVWRL